LILGVAAAFFVSCAAETKTTTTTGNANTTTTKTKRRAVQTGSNIH
jgi:hypothetical protein